jgi:hypothetical protein
MIVANPSSMTRGVLPNGLHAGGFAIGISRIALIAINAIVDRICSNNGYLAFEQK